MKTESRALYNASLDDVEIEEPAPLVARVSRKMPDGKLIPCPFPELILLSALNPPPGSARGVSLLRGAARLSARFCLRFIAQQGSTGNAWEMFVLP